MDIPDNFRIGFPPFLHELVHSGLVVLSALPQDVHSFAAGTALGYPFPHALVETAAPEASSYNEDMFAGRVESIFPDSFFLHLRGARDEDAADRVPGHHYLLFREEALHAFVSDADALNLPGQFLVGESREAVLLLDHRRDAEPGGCVKEGSAGISSYSHRHVRLEILDYPLRLPDAGKDFERNLYVVDNILEIQLPLKSYDRQADDLVACRRDLLHLHLAIRTHKQYLRFGIEFLQLACDGNGREYVSSRAAAADYDSQCFVIHNIISSCHPQACCPGRPGR